MQDLAGRVAVVTGAASGIGAGLARAFAREGMRLVLADVEIEPARKLADELSGAGTDAVAIRSDVARSADLRALADHAYERFGAVHLLCNNAGVCLGGPVHEMTERDWRWMLSVNLMGVVGGCREFVPRMIAQGEPAHIVNTASVGGFLAGGSLGLYTTTKFAIVAYSESLAQDLAGHDIGVSVLCPSATRTNLAGSQRNRPAELGSAPARLEMLEPALAAGMDPQEVGRLTVRGIRENALYIFTDAVFRDAIAARFERVLAAVDRAAQPLD